MVTFKEISEAMADAVETAGASLVTVEARRRQSATGIIFSADGIIVTAHHVVERDENIHVVLPDGERVEAKLIGRDPHNDLAVLRIEKSGLTAANWGDNDNLRVGNLALAIGRADNRLEAAPGAVVSLVSNEERHENRERRGRGRGGKRGGRRGGKGRHRRMRILSDGFIQTNVVMYPGFSGGALVSGGGEIHGINTSGFSRQGGVTVPVTTIKNTVETLLAHGKMKQGYLGVGIQPVRLPEAIAEDREQETALLVNSIESNSPAEHAGILVGDILVAMDDDSLEQMDDLMGMLRGERIGQESTLELIRGGELMETKVTVGERE